MMVVAGVGFLGKVYAFAREKHGKQEDDLGCNYFEAHVCQVATIVQQITQDPEIVAAALLHDTLEDTKTTYQELVDNFGQRVADLVHEVTHEGTKETGHYFPRLKSRDAVLIKFADRLSNLSRMEPWNEKRRQQYLKRSRFWKLTADEKVN